MKCTACGENNVDRAKFCAFCGAKLEEQRHMPTLQAPVEESKAEERSEYARPLGDNPIQPARRAMPHISTGGEASSRATATPHFTPMQSSAPAAPVQAVPVPPPPPAEKAPKVFLFDEEIEEEEEKRKDEEERRRREEFRKAHSKPDDELFYDEDDLEYGEDFEDEDPKGGRVFIKIISVLTALALVAAVVGVLFATPLGGRLRAQWGISNNYEDYLALAQYQLSRGNAERADNYYLSAFKLKSDDYDVSLRIAAGFEACGDSQRAEQLYTYLIEHYPTEDAPYDHLMAILYNQGRLEQYEALLDLRSVNQPTFVAPIVYAAPVPSMQSGTYIQPVTLSLTAEGADEIRFTLDGSDAGADSQLYTTPLTISSGSFEIHTVAIYGSHMSSQWIGRYTVGSSAG